LISKDQICLSSSSPCFCISSSLSVTRKRRSMNEREEKGEEKRETMYKKISLFSCYLPTYTKEKKLCILYEYTHLDVGNTGFSLPLSSFFFVRHIYWLKVISYRTLYLYECFWINSKKKPRWGTFFVDVRNQPWKYITNNPSKKDRKKRRRERKKHHLQTDWYKPKEKKMNIGRKPCMTKLYE
jgi:hypothetical protein